MHEQADEETPETNCSMVEINIQESRFSTSPFYHFISNVNADSTDILPRLLMGSVLKQIALIIMLQVTSPLIAASHSRAAVVRNRRDCLARSTWKYPAALRQPRKNMQGFRLLQA
jgi:hypothetical protein